MIRYIAFLRAINVGGRRVKMDRLREVFREMGFSDVETFINSGNVIFDSPETDTAALERAVEAGLLAGLGFHSDTFIRTAAELAAVAAKWPFDETDHAAVVEGDNMLYITFIGSTPDEDRRQKLQTYTTDIDEFHIDGREVYWLCRRSLQGDSTFSAAILEKVLGMPGTLRNGRTVGKMAAKYSQL